MKAFLWSVVIWVWALSEAWAGGFQLSYQGQRQLGMGHVGTAIGGDISNIYFNPGGLAFIRRGGIQFGSSAVFPTTSFLEAPPSIYLTSTEPQVVTPVYLYAAFKGKAGSSFRRFTFGLGFNNPFGGASKWENDWAGKYISQEFSINTFFLQPTLSYQVNERLGIGLGFSFGFATLLSRKALRGTDGPNSSLGSAELTGTGDGWGFSLGLYYLINEQVSLGLSYRSAIEVDIKQGKALFDVPVSLAENFPVRGFRTRFTLPQRIQVGLAYRPEERMLLGIDLNWTGWGVFDSLSLVFDEPVSDLREYPSRQYINSISLRIGGEYNVNEWFRFRAGVHYDGSPVPNKFLTPELPDGNRIGVSMGLGFSIGENLQLDLSYQYDFTGERTALYEEAGFGGKYQSTTSVAGIGIAYAF